MNTVHKPTSFAEVIESFLAHYTAQCWEWNSFPTFGALVQVVDGNKTVFGIVTDAQTGSIDPTRTPFAYKKTEAELQAEQPHIFEFLKTTFTVQVCGYAEHPHHIIYSIPTNPCKIHAFVSECDDATVAKFFGSAHFVEVLYGFAQHIPNLDELLLAILRHLKSRNLLTSTLLDDLTQKFAVLSGNDYRRIKVFLSRVELLIK